MIVSISLAGHAALMLVFAASTATLKAGATTADPFLWYVTRAAAVSGYVTLSATVVLGLVRSLGRVTHVRLSWMLDEVHQFLALLTAGLVALHLISLVFDPLIPFSVLNLLIPLSQPYRPFAVDLGVLTLYGLVIVLASSWLRHRMKYASWRALHYISFAVFVLVTLHGILAGSDAGEAWMRDVYLGASGLIMLLVLVRIFMSADHQEPRSPVRPPSYPPTRSRARSMV